MMGGYIEDRFIQPVNKDSYSFLHWSGVDIFVYFSHNFITIPPPGWIRAAQLHGVAVLGTIITEWDEGKQILETIISDPVLLDVFVDKCGDIAEHHGFQGWLLNIENEVNISLVPNLILLVGKLRARMKMITDDCLVIWYDSVTIQGELKWQDELNSLNKPFFDECDGIFLNYCWKLPENSDPPKDSLNNCLETLGSQLDRRTDIFVGVDVFGRGCFGGGGFNCSAALSKIRERNLSCAIFAPGWTYELPHRENRVEIEFMDRENLFWENLEPFLNFQAVNLDLDRMRREEEEVGAGLNLDLDRMRRDEEVGAGLNLDLDRMRRKEEVGAGLNLDLDRMRRKEEVGAGLNLDLDRMRREEEVGAGLNREKMRLVFRSCFSSGRGNQWFHLLSLQPQPSLISTNIQNSAKNSSNTDSSLLSSTTSTPSPISPLPPVFCCYTTHTKTFVGHRSLYIEASEPGLVVPVFLFDLNPQGITLTFLLVLSRVEEKVGGVDLVLGLDTGSPLIVPQLDDATVQELDVELPQINADWKLAGYRLENCLASIEKLGLRPCSTTPLYLGQISIFSSKS
ncbi:cytosolic endo-beta-N-acetylglucosaminidase isoform X2 [Eurytemora carolleeae]|nr:cytosolic endo-beta-N-acetylglucosaminidase isoform X2 [Eurytemora carolleeae]|eukprot:XP_023324291.1 cytosolic endo-beta-N-acetylglucosaminidase-like isoform X2 [Eurytemora affinis]